MSMTSVISNPEPINLTSTIVETEELTSTEEQSTLSSGVVRLRLHKTDDSKKVQWTQDTVDNENMGKKKSKCCCIYVKPNTEDNEAFSEDSDGECENCSGHVELSKHQLKQTGN